LTSASTYCIDEQLRQAVRELRHAHILWLTGVLGALAASRGFVAGFLGVWMRS